MKKPTVHSKFAPLLFLISIVFFNLGSALATQLFKTLGVMGTVNIQFFVAAIILLAITRPNLRKLNLSTVICLILHGLTLCSIEVFFFQAIARLPIGVVVSICFCGPLFLSLTESDSLKDLTWVSLAAVGLLLILPIQDFATSTDLLGYLFALIASASIAFYILLSKRLYNKLPGLQGLAIGMIICAFATLPFAINTFELSVFNPSTILWVLVVATIGIVLPYGLEYFAISKIETKTIGIISSSKPIIAAVIGLVVLGDILSYQELLAFACITIASIGATSSTKEKEQTVIPKSKLPIRKSPTLAGNSGQN